MSSAIGLPNHKFTGQALSSKCAHSFTRNWQLPFLNQWKGENEMIFYRISELMLPTLIQIYDKNHVIFDPVQKQKTN